MGAAPQGRLPYGLNDAFKHLELRMTSIPLAEIRHGIARLPDGRRKQVLVDTADDIFRAFPTRYCRSTRQPPSRLPHPALESQVHQRPADSQHLLLAAGQPVRGWHR
jgi:hypothetical protein